MQPTEVDVLIVGAGLSGIGAAYHLQSRCPGRTYAIFEARQSLGGTWDLFRYPGIRSDSDMYTLGYSFRPWDRPKAIADGASILAYIRETAEAHGIDARIRYGHRVERVRWSPQDARWTVLARQAPSDRAVELRCKFLFICAGYYDYEAGYTPPLPGRERFRGRVVHPQSWTPDVDYAGKRVVIIGSGATAVTLVPELAKQAAHVTMLQRSPTYVIAMPDRDRVADWMRERLPVRSAYSVTRWKNVLLGMAFFAYCRRFPQHARRLLLAGVHRQLDGKVKVRPHFAPAYKPWDQRLCLVPNGDLFVALREGRASVVTDRIETFTESGIRLEGGDTLEADLVVTATGINLKFLGGVQLEVDGQRIDLSKTMIYKGMMCSDVPNLAFAMGYTNASWTLKCDLTSQYVCRLLNYMADHGYDWACARRDPSVHEEPILALTSGYIQRSIEKLPRQGGIAPWRVHQNYALDRFLLERMPVDDPAMEFSRRADVTPAPRPSAAVA